MKHGHAQFLRIPPCVRFYLAASVFSGLPAAAGPFAASVISYDPAPGQFVNDSRFNVPTRALGTPKGGGTGAADNTRVVTLGGFGGSITLAFDHTVKDDPLNPFGMDAIVFGNTFWPAPAGIPDPSLHWAECTTIEICFDANGNGQPDEDEPWYLIPGSHIADPAAQFVVETWDNLIDDETFPPASAAWIPQDFTGEWTTEGYELPADLFGPPVVSNPSPDPTVEGIFGYAEYSPTLVLGDLNADNVVNDPTVAPEAFYTVPDDPFTVGITPGSGGGDAFDIAWAIDPATGLPADLPGFDFIRLTTAVNAVDTETMTGEKSAEIDAVADVAPDPFGDFDEDGDIDLRDIAALQNCFGVDTAVEPNCGRLDRQPDGLVDLSDAVAMVERLIGPNRNSQ